MPSSSSILETPRLALREMTRDDLDFVAAMLADPEVMRYYPKCYNRDEAAAWVDRQLGRYREHGRGLWLAVDRMSGEPVGQVGLIASTHEVVPEDEIDGLIRFTPTGVAACLGGGVGAVLDTAFGTLGQTRSSA